MDEKKAWRYVFLGGVLLLVQGIVRIVSQLMWGVRISAIFSAPYYVILILIFGVTASSLTFRSVYSNVSDR